MTHTPPNALIVENLSKSFPPKNRQEKAIQVLSGISFTVPSGELLTIVGPNACGKTTLLNILAGLLPADSGHASVDGQRPDTVTIGYVVQDYRESLLPWKTNIDNIAFPLEVKGMAQTTRRDRARSLLARFKISIPEHGYPYELSGGQAQLVAILRAIVDNPRLLFLDEPFNQLDLQTRLSLQDTLLEVWRETKTTILFVSHDIDEAILLGQRIIILSKIPSRIHTTVETGLPPDRNHSTLSTDAFFKVKREIVKFYEEILQ